MDAQNGANGCASLTCMVSEGTVREKKSYLLLSSSKGLEEA